MKKSQGQRKGNHAILPVQTGSSTSPQPTDDQQLASFLTERGIDLTNGSPGIFEMLAFRTNYDEAIGHRYDEALAGLSCLAFLIAENPRMAPLRSAILAIVDADRTLSAAMSALREI